MSIASLQLIMPKQNLSISQETIALYRDILVNQVLNVDDFAQYISKVTTSLHGLNRTALDGDLRLSSTEHIINQYILFIRQVRSGNLSLNAKQTAKLSNLNREFSFATKILLRDAIAHSKEELANFVYWATCTLAEQLYDYSLQRRAQPESLWSELNRLYQFSEVRYLTDFHSNRPDNRDIESRYKQALLFQAAQPDHLHDKEQILLDSYLTKWSFRAYLQHQESREFNTHYFYVDLEAAGSAETSRRIDGVANSLNIRALNPLPIIEQVRTHMKQLRGSMQADKIGFPKGTDNIDAFMTLKKVLLSWKQESTRRFQRAHCSVSTHTAIGLKTIHHYLSSPTAHTEKLLYSATINMSKTGACIKLGKSTDSINLCVGDVVIHKINNNSQGRLAAVRWLKCVGESFVFGIEYFVGNLQPVTIKVHDHATEGLLISTSDNDALITHRGCCASNTPIQLKNTRHGIYFDARVQALVQRGQHIDQIRLKRSQTA
jgi:hypothetical protein